MFELGFRNSHGDRSLGSITSASEHSKPCSGGPEIPLKLKNQFKLKPTSNIRKPIAWKSWKCKTALHNAMERQRRANLKTDFDNLRDQVPQLQLKNARTSKIAILTEATKYIRSLTLTNKNYKSELEHLETTNLELKKRYEELKEAQ